MFKNLSEEDREHYKYSLKFGLALVSGVVVCDLILSLFRTMLQGS